MILSLIAGYMHRYHRPEATLEEIMEVLGPKLSDAVKIPVRILK